PQLVARLNRITDEFRRGDALE
ncbi:MAG: hypothetical protein JWQ45_1314, partial [Blastococcus sp.]|nr:hypothetical protein [Blastococcus sp.]